jgi:hypothetical protein
MNEVLSKEALESLELQRQKFIGEAYPRPRRKRKCQKQFLIGYIAADSSLSPDHDPFTIHDIEYKTEKGYTMPICKRCGMAWPTAGRFRCSIEFFPMSVETD